MLEACYSKEREMIIVKRDGQELLYIEEFQDRSHPGHHLFLTPAPKANLCKTEAEEVPWTHELLKN